MSANINSPSRRLSQQDRAFVRLLVGTRRFPIKAVAREFSCSESTVKRAIKNDYKTPDNVSKDQEVVAKNQKEFDAILQVLTERKDPSEEAPQTPPVQENSASLSSSANAHSFLETFVGHVRLDNSWVAKLEAAGFTEDTMVEMANVPSLQIMEFLAAAFPEMTDVQRFLFATRIKGFNTAT
ncbi:hypothetical protein B0H13DRAFT_1870273 [Mycena leptocephala]|nr:hypothetical protein B0H13DRAFT_1870273 [Mycena leptocephala]